MSTPNTLDILLGHRSIRKFTSQAIPSDVLNSILASGQAASTSSFCQSTSVIRVTDSAIRAQLAEWAGPQKYVEQAPEFLVFCADLWRAHQTINKFEGKSSNDLSKFSWAEQLLTSTIDTALFAQNCAIAAESQQLGVCFIGGIRNKISAVSDVLGLPDLCLPLFGMCLGYPDQAPTLRPRLPQNSVVFENAYGELGDDFYADLDSYNATIKAYYEQRTGGKLSQTWTEQLAKQAARQTRPHILEFLRSKGFIQR